MFTKLALTAVYALLVLRSPLAHGALEGCSESLLRFAGEVRSKTWVQLEVREDLQSKRYDRLVHLATEVAPKSKDLVVREHTLTYELSPGDSAKRRENDPRWFGKWGWRRDITNPYTKSLRAQWEYVVFQQELERVLSEATALEVLKPMYLEQYPKMSTEERVVFGTLLTRASWITSRFLAQPSAATLQGAQELKRDLALFQTYLATPREQRGANSLWLGQLQKADRAFELRSERKVAEILKRQDMRYGSYLLAMTRESKESLTGLTERFEAIDALGRLRRTRQTHGIYDLYVIGLTKIAQDFSMRPKEVVDLFFEIDGLGGKSPIFPSWTIEDAGVVLLTQASLRLGQSPQALVDYFYQVVHTWKTKHSGFNMDDRDLARLTRLGLQYRVSAEEVFDSYVEAYNLGKTTEPGFHLDDPASIDLVEIALAQGQSVSLSVAAFFDLYYSQKQPKVTLGDYALTDLLRVARRTLLTPSEMGQWIKIVRDLDPDASDAKIVSVVTASLDARFSVSHDHKLTREELQVAVDLLGVPTPNLQGWMERSMKYRTYTQRSSSNSSSSSSSSSSGSDLISPLQGMMTGNYINLDNNPFTPF